MVKVNGNKLLANFTRQRALKRRKRMWKILFLLTLSLCMLSSAEAGEFDEEPESYALKRSQEKKRKQIFRYGKRDMYGWRFPVLNEYMDY
ncbi:hypothetical protein FGIG_05510 [Fasciola gigantica]|uniref:Uncharacterized protein n=1 Tax=Fasciola gigantica TaxID=46835 RepID=A0A504Z4Q6_FASGI|nr:hypothetical protein FGIG_05510 [Fasciola gigantica]